MGKAHRRTSWTAEKKAILKKKYGTMPIEQLAHELECTVSALVNQASIMALRLPKETRHKMRGKSRSWSDEDDAFLKENYEILEREALARKLGRSVAAIGWRMHVLSLKLSKETVQDRVLRGTRISDPDEVISRCLPPEFLTRKIPGARLRNIATGTLVEAPGLIIHQGDR